MVTWDGKFTDRNREEFTVMHGHRAGLPRVQELAEKEALKEMRSSRLECIFFRVSASMGSYKDVHTA